MTRAYDSTSKRTELVRAATQLFHQQGYHRTSLDNVAKQAGVPLGNVHYYFSTKQSLAEAVIASHAGNLQQAFDAWATVADPGERLRKLVRAPLSSVESVIRFGCPHGSLCQELEKSEDESPLTKAGAQLLSHYVDWAQEQLLLLGWDKASAQAVSEQLVAQVQGTMLLAHSLRSPALLARQLERVEGWLDQTLHPQKRSPT